MKENIDPPMHTAEHILNQTMVRMFGGGRCFSSHIERKKSKCNYRFGRALTEDEIKSLTDQVNEIIEADLPVTESYAGKEEAVKIYASYGLAELPDNAPDKFRVIRIGNYDEILCYGPHVNSTKELGLFRVVSSSFEDGILRIRYKLR